jgi:fermentation-respiration switch protein FrsA (DUF1100 family)
MGKNGSILAPDDILVNFLVGDVNLAADFHYPAGIPTLVVFTHGSCSSRSSPSNRFAANTLYLAGMGTLFFDLLPVNYKTSYFGASTGTQLRFNL